MRARSTLLSSAILGATGVGLGAFGAHKLEPFLLERGMVHAWDTAVRYQLVHAVALAALAAWQRHDAAGNAAPSGIAGWAARCWTVGIVLFSGSLYGLALGGPRLLGPVTPLGGTALIAGWCCLLAMALRESGEKSPHA
jgi:uncharacterized membrane protein YgdD (TMEM256/DUF423 family)